MQRKQDQKQAHDRHHMITDDQRIQLLSEVVLSPADIFWKDQTWKKNVPSGVKDLAECILVFKGRKLAASDMKAQFGNKILTDDIDSLKRNIWNVLHRKTKKSGLFDREPAYGLLVEDPQGTHDNYLSGRDKTTAALYSSTEQLFSGDPDKEQHAIKALKELREMIVKKIESPALKKEEQSLLDNFSRMLLSFKEHVVTSCQPSQMDPLLALPKMQAKETKLSDECKAKFQLLRPEIQFIKTQINDLVKESEFKSQCEQWFSRFTSLYYSCSGENNTSSRICNDDIEDLNKIPREVNFWILEKNKNIYNPEVDHSSIQFKRR